MPLQLGTMLALANLSMQMTCRLKAISSPGLTKAANKTAQMTSGWGKFGFAFIQNIKTIKRVHFVSFFSANPIKTTRMSIIALPFLPQIVQANFTAKSRRSYYTFFT